MSKQGSWIVQAYRMMNEETPSYNPYRMESRVRYGCQHYHLYRNESKILSLYCEVDKVDNPDRHMCIDHNGAYNATARAAANFAMRLFGILDRQFGRERFIELDEDSLLEPIDLSEYPEITVKKKKEQPESPKSTEDSPSTDSTLYGRNPLADGWRQLEASLRARGTRINMADLTVNRNDVQALGTVTGRTRALPDLRLVRQEVADGIHLHEDMLRRYGAADADITHELLGEWQEHQIEGVPVTFRRRLRNND